MRFSITLLVTLVVTFSGVGGSQAEAGWEEALDALVATADDAECEPLIADVLDYAPSWQEVATRIRSATFPTADPVGQAVLRTTVCIDTVERPWVLQIPPDYDPSVPTPLLVVLHGGVGTADIRDDPLGSVSEDELGALALERGWISVFPFGQAGATWFDEVGMTNIRDLVRTVKRELNVDDDRVWMAGFSDGVSAGFAYAMLAPSDYAAFVALNGHMGVASLDFDHSTYAPSMSATPIFATTTFDDWLYPSHKMRPTIEMAREAGADIYYREFPGGHDFDDVKAELPAVARFLERHPRDPFPSRIVWETGSTDFGECRWFAIDRITNDEPAPWHEDHNVALTDDRVTIGFQPDYEFEGPGVLVGVLSDGDYPARNIGLKAGDVIVKADAARLDSLPDLNDWKDTVERGDAFEMTVLRDGEEVVLRGKLPEPAGYLIFKRDVPSAAIRAGFAANRIDVQTSRVGAFSVLVHPDMIVLEQPLVIVVNGEVVFDDTVRADLKFLLENYLDNRDRSLLCVAEVVVDLQ
jgi:pimeloyl-ACP methyl ester carboxylesterase